MSETIDDPDQPQTPATTPAPREAPSAISPYRPDQCVPTSVLFFTAPNGRPARNEMRRQSERLLREVTWPGIPLGVLALVALLVMTKSVIGGVLILMFVAVMCHRGAVSAKVGALELSVRSGAHDQDRGTS